MLCRPAPARRTRARSSAARSKPLQRVIEQRLAGERQILLGQVGAHARTAAGGGNQGEEFRHGYRILALSGDCISSSTPYLPCRRHAGDAASIIKFARATLDKPPATLASYNRGDPHLHRMRLAMNTVRPPAVAGLFYPAAAPELRATSVHAARAGGAACARQARAQGDHRAARRLHLFRSDRRDRLRAARARARHRSGASCCSARCTACRCAVSPCPAPAVLATPLGNISVDAGRRRALSHCRRSP